MSETIEDRKKRIKNLEFSISKSKDELAILVKEQKVAIKLSHLKVKVKCNGDSSHQCEKRKCLHRKPHFPKNQCNQVLHNFGRWWCECPETESLQHIGRDGSVVMCIPVGK